MKLYSLILIMLLSTIYPLFPTDVGEQSPQFVNLDLNNQHTYSRNILGQSWVILDFFATDCEPCQQELPQLESLYEAYKERGLQVVVMVTDQEGAAAALPYFQQHPTALMVLLDRFQVTTGRFGVTEIPSVFLINPQGVIALKCEGYSKQFIQRMRDLLNENLPPE